MPFEISPGFIPTKAPAQPQHGQFKVYAEALLRGAAQTDAGHGRLYREGREHFFGSLRRRPQACALGALLLGLGRDPNDDRYPDVDRLNERYWERYGALIERDNDDRVFTREEIAARIAAL